MSTFGSAARAFGRVGRGTLEGLLGTPVSLTAQGFRNAPGPMILGLGYGIPFANEQVVDPIYEAYTQPSPTTLMLQAVEDQRRKRFEGKLRQARQEEALNSMSLSLQQLAATDPKLYTEVMYGMRLPEGAVVLGGQPRRDLLTELSYAMASGQFQQPQPAQGALDSLLGVQPSGAL